MQKKIMFAVSALVLLGACVAFAQKNAPATVTGGFQKYFLPKNEIHYFADDMGSSLMELRPDGRYKSQAYNNKQKGTWQQLEDGRVRLASETRYRPIYTDEFNISVGDKDSLAQIPAMRDRLTALLAGNDRSMFTIREIQDASKYTCCEGKEAPGVSPFSPQKEFARTDLIDLISAMDKYLKDEEKNTSYYVAYQYPQFGFFQDDFSSYEVPPTLIEKIEKDGVKVPDGDGYIGRLNNLLKIQSLRGHFSKVQLSVEAEALSVRGSDLTKEELMKLNRLVLEAAYPKECPKGISDREVVFLFEGTNEFENLDGIKKKIDTGFAPQFAMRKIDKARYVEFISEEDEQARAFGKMDQQHKKDIASAPKLPPAEASVYLFSKGKPEYFAQSGAHTEYMVFLPDGTYKETESGHFGVNEWDKGTWEQSSDGRIKMVSVQRLHTVESGSLSVFIVGQEDISRLSVIKEKIDEFLANNTKETFTTSDIMGLMQFQSRNGDMVSVVRLSSPAETTTRNNLKKLQAKIDGYLKNPDKNVFYCTPYVYREAKVLIFEDQFGSLDDIKASIDRKEIPFVFMGVDEKRFEEGSGKPQPFRFYPGMNKAVEKMQKDKKSSSQ